MLLRAVGLLSLFLHLLELRVFVEFFDIGGQISFFFLDLLFFQRPGSGKGHGLSFRESWFKLTGLRRSIFFLGIVSPLFSAFPTEDSCHVHIFVSLFSTMPFPRGKLTFGLGSRFTGHLRLRFVGLHYWLVLRHFLGRGEHRLVLRKPFGNRRRGKFRNRRSRYFGSWSRRLLALHVPVLGDRFARQDDRLISGRRSVLGTGRTLRSLWAFQSFLSFRFFESARGGTFGCRTREVRFLSTVALAPAATTATPSPPRSRLAVPRLGRVSRLPNHLRTRLLVR